MRDGKIGFITPNDLKKIKPSLRNRILLEESGMLEEWQELGKLIKQHKKHQSG